MVSHPPRVRSTNNSWSTCQDTNHRLPPEPATRRDGAPPTGETSRWKAAQTEKLSPISKSLRLDWRIKRFGEEKSTVFDRANQHWFSWINDQTSLLIRISLRMKQPSRREGKRHRKITSRVGWAKETHETPIKQKPGKRTPEESRRRKYYRSYHSPEAKAGKAGDSEQPLPRVRAPCSGLCTGLNSGELTQRSLSLKSKLKKRKRKHQNQRHFLPLKDFSGDKRKRESLLSLKVERELCLRFWVLLQIFSYTIKQFWSRKKYKIN